MAPVVQPPVQPGVKAADAPSVAAARFRPRQPGTATRATTAAETSIIIPATYGSLNSGLSAGAIVGITLGSVIGFLLLLGLVYVVVNDICGCDCGRGRGRATYGRRQASMSVVDTETSFGTASFVGRRRHLRQGGTSAAAAATAAALAETSRQQQQQQRRHRHSHSRRHSHSHNHNYNHSRRHHNSSSSRRQRQSERSRPLRAGVVTEEEEVVITEERIRRRVPRSPSPAPVRGGVRHGVDEERRRPAPPPAPSSLADDEIVVEEEEEEVDVRLRPQRRSGSTGRRRPRTDRGADDEVVVIEEHSPAPSGRHHSERGPRPGSSRR